MDARRTFLALLALTVPLSSLLGLAPAMGVGGPEMFPAVWSANLWGDLAFAAGTVAATVAVARVMDRVQPGRRGLAFAAGVPVAFLLHWAAYAVAWTLTFASFGEDAPFLAVQPVGFGEALVFTVQWGWMGLAVMSLASPGLALWALARDDKARSAAEPPDPRSP